MLLPSKLSYAAFLKYSPRGTSKAATNSQAIRTAIKNDQTLQFLKDGKLVEYRGIEYVVTGLKSEIGKFPFLSQYLSPDVSLVPIPRSAPLTSKDALWPTRRICEALVAAGLGAEVSPLLIRTIAVQKSATAEKGQRPGPEKHYESTSIDNNVPTLVVERPLTMVDDFTTRGSSFVGMWQRLHEAFPNRTIKCFAMMATDSDEPMDKLVAPVEGTIFYYAKTGKLFRDRGTAEQGNLF
jgi:hypothetical protein